MTSPRGHFGENLEKVLLELAIAAVFRRIRV